MAGTEIGALLVRIGGDAGDLVNELQRARGELRSTADYFEAAGKAAKALAAGALAAGTAIAYVVKQAIDSADAISKMAQSTGMSTEAVSEYVYAAKLGNVESAAFGTAMARLSRNMVDAAEGTGEATRAFDALGIKARDGNGQLKGADQIMAEVADKFRGMEDGANKTALAMLIFGRAGAEMIPMLNQGSEAIARAREEARQLGVTMDTETGKAAEAFKDNLTRLEAAGQGLGNSLMRELLPPLIGVTDQLVEAAKAGGSLHNQMKPLADFIQSAGLTVFQTLAVAGANVAYVLKQVGNEIGGIGAQLGALAHGDFKAFSEIGEQMKQDAELARKEVDDFSNRIMNLKVPKAKLEVDTGAGPKSQGPRVQSSEQINQAKKDAEDTAKAVVAAEEMAAQDSHEAWDAYYKFLRQVGVDTTHDLEVDARGKITAIHEMTRESAEGIADLQKAGLKSLMESIDAEQTAAIQAGQQILDADGLAHSEKLKQMQDSLASEEDLENEAYAKRLEQLQEFSDAELQQMGGAAAVRENMERDHMQRIYKIRSGALNDMSKFNKANWAQQANTMLGELVNMTAGVAQHNRKMFEVNKAAAIGEALINAYLGISKTLATYPFPWNIAMAAAHAVVAFAQVSAIQSQSFQGGGAGAAPSTAGSTAATPVSDVGSGGAAAGGGLGGGSTIVHLHGDNFSQKQVRELVDQINQNMADGGRIVLA